VIGDRWEIPTVMRKRYSLSLLYLFIALVGFAQIAPKVTLSSVRVPHKEHIEMKGAGFTPKANVSSHLKRPDGSEFPVLPMLTNNRGELLHDIDTLLLEPGTYEVWVVDDASKALSNTVRFEVTSK
jgi:hypothetical protein